MDLVAVQAVRPGQGGGIDISMFLVRNRIRIGHKDLLVVIIPGFCLDICPLVPGINFRFEFQDFVQAVGADDEGNMQYLENNSKAGDSVELRFEMDTLVLLHTCPHPLNPAEEYPRKPIKYQIIQGEKVTKDDYCMNFRPENERGFKNNEIFHLGGGCCHD